MLVLQFSLVCKSNTLHFDPDLEILLLQWPLNSVFKKLTINYCSYTKGIILSMEHLWDNIFKFELRSAQDTNL